MGGFVRFGCKDSDGGELVVECLGCPIGALRVLQGQQHLAGSGDPRRGGECLRAKLLPLLHHLGRIRRSLCVWKPQVGGEHEKGVARWESIEVP